MNNNISRRDFLKRLGIGTSVAGLTLAGCKNAEKTVALASDAIEGEMTYRTNPKTGEKVSILGYGCMRWPTKPIEGGKEGEEEIDQEMVNRLVDTALENGVNYFDTSPVYCQGMSERSTGIALSRHPRESYYIATKLSNFNPATHSREASIAMYENSKKELQTDYIDYMLLHAVGGGGLESLRQRYIDNGVLDFLMKEREEGRIKNLGFSYHGDIEVFDYLLSKQDEYKWDFVQIQLNYLDWKRSKEEEPLSVNAHYLYDELEKRGIPAVIMEPLLGGRLAKVPDNIANRLKQREPEESVASWAFRFAGTHPDILTVLSGMTYMEHLEDNLHTYSPLKPLTEDDLVFLQETADIMKEYPTVPCNDCKYCMPCPYGIDIPANLLHYNKCVNEDNIPTSRQSPNYAQARRAFLVSLDRSVPKLRQASHCIGCNQCVSHCPQEIDIPKELHRIDDYVEKLKQQTI
ncbi:MAG: aldo/keto reductase [Muribaculaceae bacterium]|nr:aldo/keto reductase [Muribaculaceae bacterium]